jgi:hypothetical protein
MKYIGFLLMILRCSEQKVPPSETKGFPKESQRIVKLIAPKPVPVWQQFLERPSFSQVHSDSNYFAYVKPNYALFAAFSVDTTIPNWERFKYDVAHFKKEAGTWIPILDTSFKASIMDTPILNLKNKWRFTDINGDGQPDLLLKTAQDGRDNRNYLCFLQDSQRQQFREVPPFQQIGNPEYDSITHLLRARGSFHHGWYEESYRWNGFQLKFIQGKETTMYKGEASEEIYYKKEH